MNDRSREWFISKINEYDLELLSNGSVIIPCNDEFHNVERVYSLQKVAETMYGIEAFEHYDLKVWGVETVYETDVVAKLRDPLFLQKNFSDEIPKNIEFWIELYHKERRDNLARLAGLDPEQMLDPPKPFM